MKFRTAFSKPKTIYSNIGTPTVPTYKYVIDPDTGRRKWKENGEDNIYEKIQASLEQSKLINIIKRATLGDESVLNAVQGSWVDLTEMPTSMMEAQSMVLNIKNQFEDLPLEIRKKFENDPELYVSKYGTKEWAEALGYNKPKEVSKAVAEVSKAVAEVKEEVKTE